MLTKLYYHNLNKVGVRLQDVEPLVEKQADQLFRLVHTAPFPVAVQVGLRGSTDVHKCDAGGSAGMRDSAGAEVAMQK